MIEASLVLLRFELFGLDGCTSLHIVGAERLMPSHEREAAARGGWIHLYAVTGRSGLIAVTWVPG